MVMASFGAALVVAACLDGFSRHILRLVAAAGAVVILVASMGTLANGRLGLPAGDTNDRLSFGLTLAESHGPGRILHAAVDRTLIPGEARSGPGFWYRVLDATGTTLDEVWLPPEQVGDVELSAALDEVASGAELRPGRRLSAFAIDWVVLEGPTFVLDDVLLAQLDLAPLPLDPDSRVYENTVSAPIAGTRDSPWARSGTGFTGPGSDGEVPLAVSFDEGWSEDGAPSGWSVVVDGTAGRAWFSPEPVDLALVGAPLVVFLAAFGMIVWGRRRR
jgi:hypothetical protein